MTTKKKESKGKPHLSATASSILGRPMTKPREEHAAVKVKGEWQKYYRHLIELRDQLLRQMNGLAKESAQEISGYSLHMADSGTDNFDRDFALSLLSSDQDAIYEIEEALKRIEKEHLRHLRTDGKIDPEAEAGSHPLDALHRASPGATGTRGRVAAAPAGRPGHRG